jgi:formamidopyrimidine-DNA glycosylase
LPELPEVETVVRSISPYIEGRTILRAELRSRLVTRGDFAAAEAGLTGAVINEVRRRGKQIFFDLDRGVLYIHLGMTGKLLWNADPGKYTRALLELENGTLLFDDIRQFGRFDFYHTLPPQLSDKGPDALDLTFDVFYSRLKRHRGSIKAVLLNQSFISGVGNIYADELLFAARVHPGTPVPRISKARAQRIHQKLLETLQLAVELRGSSISDYVDGAGNPGEFQQMHRVYGRAGEPCRTCGTAVKRIVIAQRGTHYCPRCQRA